MTKIRKLNCWEFNQCQHDPTRPNARECPARTTIGGDGVNEGKNGGRCCWMIAGTCRNEDSTVSEKLTQCLSCEFYKLVEFEEDENFESFRIIDPTPNIAETARDNPQKSDLRAKLPKISY